MIAPAEPIPTLNAPETPGQKGNILSRFTQFLRNGNQVARQRGEIGTDVPEASSISKEDPEVTLEEVEKAIAIVEKIIADKGPTKLNQEVLKKLQQQKELISREGVTRKDKFLAKARGAFAAGSKMVADFLGSLKLPKLPKLPNLPDLGLRKPLAEQIKDIRGIGTAINADIAANREKMNAPRMEQVNDVDEVAILEGDTRPNLVRKGQEFVTTQVEAVSEKGSRLLRRIKLMKYQRMSQKIIAAIEKSDVPESIKANFKRSVDFEIKNYELVTRYLNDPSEENKKILIDFLKDADPDIDELEITTESSMEELGYIEELINDDYELFVTPASWQTALEGTRSWFAEQKGKVKLGELVTAIKTDRDTQVALISTAGQTIARALTGATGLAAATGIAAPAEYLLETAKMKQAEKAGVGVTATKFNEKFQEQTGANEKPFVMKETRIGRFFQTFQEFGKLGVRIIKLAEKAGQRGMHGVDRKLNKLQTQFVVPVEGEGKSLELQLRDMLGTENIDSGTEIAVLEENVAKILKVVQDVADLNLLLPENGRQRNLGERFFGKGIFGKGKANQLENPRAYIEQIENALKTLPAQLDVMDQAGPQGEQISPKAREQMREIKLFLENKAQYLDERAAKLWRRSAMVDAMAIVARGAVIESLVRGAEFASNLGGETPVQAIPPEVREDVVPRLNLDTDPGIGGGMPPEVPVPPVETTVNIPAFEQPPTAFAEGLTGQIVDVIEKDTNKRVPIINMFKNIQQGLNIELTTEMVPNINTLAQTYNEVFPEGANVLNFQLSEYLTEKGVDINQKPLLEAMYRQAQGIDALPGDAAVIQTALSKQS